MLHHTCRRSSSSVFKCSDMVREEVQAPEMVEGNRLGNRRDASGGHIWGNLSAEDGKGRQKASPERFEHSRAKPNRWQLRIAGDPVNHSGKVTYCTVSDAIYVPYHCLLQ